VSETFRDPPRYPDERATRKSCHSEKKETWPGQLPFGPGLGHFIRAKRGKLEGTEDPQTGTSKRCLQSSNKRKYKIPAERTYVLC